MTRTLTGSCLCGGVVYELSGDIDDIVTCHCAQCRKTTGHHVAATRTARENCRLIKDDTLQWYRSSPEAQRGFCQTCGGQLFWQADASPNISVHAGTLDTPTGLKTRCHIYVADKGDYYELEDGLPQYAQED